MTGAKFKQLRKLAGFNQVEVSVIAKVSVGTITRFEKHNANITVQKLNRLKKAIGYTEIILNPENDGN